MSVFFTDTDCEMWFTDAENLKMNVIGMPYTINGQEAVYDFGKNTNIEKFYSEMRSGKVATTAALNVQTEYFEKPLLDEDGNYQIKFEKHTEFK